MVVQISIMSVWNIHVFPYMKKKKNALVTHGVVVIPWFCCPCHTKKYLAVSVISKGIALTWHERWAAAFNRQEDYLRILQEKAIFQRSWIRTSPGTRRFGCYEGLAWKVFGSSVGWWVWGIFILLMEKKQSEKRFFWSAENTKRAYAAVAFSKATILHRLLFYGFSYRGASTTVSSTEDAR